MGDTQHDKGNTMTIDFERNAGGYENVDAEDAHNTNWQEDASATMSECGCEDCRPYYEHHTDYFCP